MRYHNGLPLYLIDYSIVGTGTVIPQARWYPENINDHRQHVADAILQMPIFFVQQNGTLGISLNDAINGRLQNLRDARMQAPLGGRATTHIRIGVCGRWRPRLVSFTLTILGAYQWRGYDEFKRQVQIRDETPSKNPITIAKFAQHVGRSVEAFLQVSLLC